MSSRFSSPRSAEDVFKCIFFRSLQDAIEKDTRFPDKNTGGVFVEY